MKLTLAAGSLGYYRVDADGNVYVPRLYARPDSIEHRLGMSPDVGDRPDPKRHQQTAYGAVYWVPHGTREDLTDEQRAELEVVLA